MCSSQRTPKTPKVAAVGAPEPPEETAQEVGRSAAASKARTNLNTLGKFDLKLPPSFQIPS